MSAGRGGRLEDRLTPVLRPVRAGNGFEEALEQILQVVRLGLVPGGDRLPAERELAERLGISRVTLREVLKVLQDQGLVERGAAGTAARSYCRAPTRAGGEDELRRRISGGGRRGHAALPGGAGGGRGGAVRAARTDGRAGGRGCGRPLRERRTHRWRTTAAWTRCCISRWPSCAAPRR